MDKLLNMASYLKTASLFYGLSASLLIGILYIVPWFSPKINNEVFPAFRAIEAACLNEQASGNPSLRCHRVVTMLKACIDSRDPCPAEDYHRALMAFGFELPPLFLQDIPKHQLPFVAAAGFSR